MTTPPLGPRPGEIPPRIQRPRPAQTTPVTITINLPQAILTPLRESITQGRSNPGEFLDRLNIIAEEILNPNQALTRQVDTMLNEIQEDMPNLYNTLQNLRRAGITNRNTASVRAFFQQFLNQSPQRAQVNLMNQFTQNQNPALHQALRRVLDSFSPENPAESETILSIASTISEAALAPADSNRRRNLGQEIDILLNRLEETVADNPLQGTPEEIQRTQERVRRQIAALRELRTVAMSSGAQNSQVVRNFFQQFRNASPQLRQTDLLQGFNQNQNPGLGRILGPLLNLLNVDNCRPRSTNEVTGGVARIAQMFLATNNTERNNFYNQARDDFQGFEGVPGPELMSFLEYARNNPNSQALREFFRNFLNQNPQSRQLQFLRGYQN